MCRFFTLCICHIGKDSTMSRTLVSTGRQWYRMVERRIVFWNGSRVVLQFDFWEEFVTFTFLSCFLDPLDCHYVAFINCSPAFHSCSYWSFPFFIEMCAVSTFNQFIPSFLSFFSSSLHSIVSSFLLFLFLQTLSIIVYWNQQEILPMSYWAWFWCDGVAYVFLRL